MQLDVSQVFTQDISQLSLERWIVVRFPREIRLHSLNGGTEEVLATLVNHPAVQCQAVRALVLVVGEANGARRVVGQSLAYDGVHSRALVTDKLVLAVREVVVACPTC